MNQLNYDYLFPSLVTYCDSPSLVTEELVSATKQVLADNPDRPFYSACASTVKKVDHLLDMPGFETLREHIVDQIQAYCQIQKIKQHKMMFESSWANLYDVGGYQDLHAHPDSMLSGVFYLKSGEEKDLIFQAPWYFFQACHADHEEITLTNCYNIEYQSVVGRCYVFPSHLMHRTLPAKSERISISFNVRYVR